MSTFAELDAIDVGDRDRSDMGDIAELAASIAAVGLLHPVVITEDGKLVAGDRRLAAVRRLGWPRIPVTVVDLDTAADVLRAEIDENTCRKPLTPYEASRARERRAQVLAPKAAENKGGRPRADSETSTNLAPVSARKTKNVAAVGTGYSGSTLDKVDRIRDAAERGVVRQGKAEVPAPEPVREVARQALADVQQTGAAVDNAHRRVAAAIEQHIDADTDVRRAREAKAWFDALRTAQRWREYDTTRLPDILSAEDWETSALLVDGLADQIGKFRAARPKHLRVVDGGTR